jgi:hypothetical protein
MVLLTALMVVIEEYGIGSAANIAEIAVPRYSTHADCGCSVGFSLSSARLSV